MCFTRLANYPKHSNSIEFSFSVIKHEPIRIFQTVQKVGGNRPCFIFSTEMEALFFFICL